MFRKSIFIMLFVCMLAPVAMAAYPWDNQMEWRGTAADGNWNNPANWTQEGTLPCPPEGPGPNFYCAVLPNQPGPRVDGESKCSMLSMNPWDPTSWGAQDCNITVLSTCVDFNCGGAIQINSQSDYDSYLGQATLLSKAILNVYGGTVRTPNPDGQTGNLTGITIGGGASTVGNAYGELNVYGGEVNVPRLALRYGQINIWGGTVICSGDSNFSILQGKGETRINVNGGTLKLRDDANTVVATLNQLILNNRLVCLRGGVLSSPVRINDGEANWAVVTGSANFNCAWAPTPDINATNVHYHSPVDGNHLTLSWTRGDIAGDVNHNVYFGTTFAAVNTATTASTQFKGTVLFSDPCAFTITDNNFSNTPGGSYYWRVDETNESGIVAQGLVWKFTSHDGKAYNPKPKNAATSLVEPFALTWTAGDWAASHKVYFSTAVGNLNPILPRPTDSQYRGIQTGTSYSLANLAGSFTIVPGNTYYWAIDEVNNTTTYKGPLWRFTAATYVTIDDFEDYNNSVEVNTVWTAGYHPIGCDSGSVASGDRIYRSDALGKYMQFTYRNNTSNPTLMYFTESKVDYGSAGTSFTGSGITSIPLKALSVDYQGASINHNDSIYDRMYVTLEDTAGNIAVYINPDVNAVTNGNWTTWLTSLTNIAALGAPSPVDTTAIKGFAIGFGDRCNYWYSSGGDGNVMFDNIRLYSSTCNTDFARTTGGLTAELTGDCSVDLNDLDYLANVWLTRAETRCWPISVPHKAPILWYKFDETESATVAADSGTGDANDYPGTAVNATSAIWSPSGHNGGCINMISGLGVYVTPPTTLMGFIKDASHITDGGGVSFSLWINSDTTSPLARTSWNGIFGIWNEGATLEDLEIHCPSPFPPTDGIGPRVNFIKRNNATPPSATAQSPINMDPTNFGGRWNHYVFLKEPTSMRVYLNGEILARIDANSQPGDPNRGVLGAICTSGSGQMRIGTRGGNWGNWPGKMDDFQVYDYALSDAEIQYLTTEGVPCVFIPLVTPANLETSGGTTAQIVDFRDMAIMSQQWHQIVMWP